LISSDTGKSRNIFGSYAFESGVRYSFWPPAPFNTCDDGGSESESPCVSSWSPPYYINNKKKINLKKTAHHTRGLGPGLSSSRWCIGCSRGNFVPAAVKLESGAKKFEVEPSKRNLDLLFKI